MYADSQITLMKERSFCVCLIRVMFSCGFIGSAYAHYDVNSNEIISDGTTVNGIL